MASTTRSGIKTSDDGNAFIPSSTRADGSTRKAIKVRPGYRPPEDVDTYKSQRAEASKNRGSGGVPGAEASPEANAITESKSRNAKRREAARKKKDGPAEGDDDLHAHHEAPDCVSNAIGSLDLDSMTESKSYTDAATTIDNAEAERQKKIRNLLKKLRGVRELKEKKATGEKLSHEQIVKIGKEEELIRDLQKLKYDMSQLDQT